MNDQVSIYKSSGKRVIDFTLSALVLIFLSPILLIITILLWFANDGKPFFVQPRPGIRGNVFTLIKYKTMTDRKDEKGELLADHLRITAIGKVIRKTSLDELPQLWNVLQGHMSLIGPRPLLSEYLPLYSERQKKRHAVRPGITGWAQINGRNTVDWNNRFEMDIWYVENISLRLDLKIGILTILKVLKRDGVNQSESVTMDKFTGS